MKRLLKRMTLLAGSALLLMTYTQCSKENFSQHEADGLPLPEISATFDQMGGTDRTKTIVGPNGKVSWISGDAVKAVIVENGKTFDWKSSYIYNYAPDEENAHKFIPQAEQGTLPAGELHDWYLVYPPTASEGIDLRRQNGMNFSAFDVMTSKELGRSAESTAPFTFNHQFALMKFTICNNADNEIKFNAVEFIAPEQVAITGNYGLEVVDKSWKLVPGEVSNIATLNFPTYKTMPSHTTKTILVMMPQFVLKSGDTFKIKTNRTDGQFYENEVKVGKDITFEAGKIHSATIVLGEPQKDPIKTVQVGDVQFNMIWVKGDSFWMGAQNSNPEGINYDPDANINGHSESPVHKVTLSEYWIGETEVTESLWSAVMGTYSSSEKPVRNVNWDDIVNVFLPRLNELTGMTFTLPTEAQWEFAARGGVKRQSKVIGTKRDYWYSGSDRYDEVCACVENAHDNVYEVKSKLPNELGIYDMSGNVWEWCSDWHADYSADPQTDPTGPETGTYRVVRGGNVNMHSYYCRTTFRAGDIVPDLRWKFGGFRIVAQQVK